MGDGVSVEDENGSVNPDVIVNYGSFSDENSNTYFNTTVPGSAHCEDSFLIKSQADSFSKANRRDRWNALSSIRWFALVHAVLMSHYSQIGLPLWDGIAAMGSSQIAFFFVLSGFLLGVRYGKVIMQRRFDHFKYALRRFWRIYPVYIFVVLLATLHTIIDEKAHSSWWKVIQTLFMLQPWTLNSRSVAKAYSGFVTESAGFHLIDQSATVLGALLFCSVFLLPGWIELLVTVRLRTLIYVTLPVLWVTIFATANHFNFQYHSLSWYLNFIPFRVNAPLFLFGVTVGIVYLRRDKSFDTFVRKWNLSYICAALFFLVILLVPISGLIPANFGTSSVVQCILAASLAPLYAALIWSVSLSSPQPNTTASALHYQGSILGSPVFAFLGQIVFAAFVLHPVVYSASRHFACREAALSSQLLNGLCWVTPKDQVVSPLFYFPVLFALAVVIYLVIEKPARSTLDSVLPSQSNADDYGIEELHVRPEMIVNQQTQRSVVANIDWNNSRMRDIWPKVMFYQMFMLLFLFGSYFVSSREPIDAVTTSDSVGWSFGTVFLDKVKWIGVIGILPLFVNVLGHLLYPSLAHRHISSAKDRELPGNMRLFFRIVTRGQNPDLVRRNVESAHQVLSGYIPAHRFVLEVVTDHSIQLDRQVPFAVCELVVPSEFETKSGAKYKARALQYAIEASEAKDNDWIIHLDEETQFDRRTLDAIYEHVIFETNAVENDPTLMPAVGQGTVLYGSGEICNLVTTLADSYRVADDYGKFRLQYASGEVYVGMHGSFVVCSNLVERLVSFDHGLAGSITEDTYFAFIARGERVNFRWIDAFMYEQSPFTFLDFVKQRARWLGGLLRVCFEDKIPLQFRLILVTFNVVWISLPLSLLILFARTAFAAHSSERTFISLLAVVQSMACWSYLHGFLLGYDIRKLGFSKYCIMLYLQLALQPVFGILESLGVCYAILNLRSVLVGFHVVQKQNQSFEYNSEQGPTTQESA
eukprot:CAMPEP_0182450730 /NCGR_PEP_ID=MMETSP1172-20130603/43336_1 /TAXON_ID=708627 /ORGANISM="Timspurckia oligopyrenoides, Strain CCMP3278" /LENGTH=984 /DNA_ID=CAMNT_0024648449 /DNA_START=192 /DNA_END=3146 /DNA_ORIENTATION=-